MKKQIMLLSAMLIGSSTAVYAATSGNCGAFNSATNTYDDCNWFLDDEGNLSITGSGKMARYHMPEHANYTPPSDAKLAPWGTEIKSVSVQGITEIGEYALFEENAAGLAEGALAGSKITTIYCAQNDSKCLSEDFTYNGHGIMRHNRIQKYSRAY